MARKKSAAKAESTPKAPRRRKAPIIDAPPVIGEARTRSLSFLRQHLEDARAEAGPGVGLVSAEDEHAVIGIPFKHISQCYLFDNDCLPLGRQVMLVGASDSCKSAFCFELLRLFALHEGIGYYQLTESRDMPDLRRSIMTPALVSHCVPIRADSTEAWMTYLTMMLAHLSEEYGGTSTDNRVPGKVDFPLLHIIDSVAGVTSQRVIDQIEKDGSPAPRISVNANMITEYLKFLCGRLARWPCLMVLTDHVKYKSNAYGHPTPVYPGGEAMRYHSTFLIDMKRVADLDNLARVAGGRRIRLETLKNSLGERSKMIEVEMVWTYEDDELGQPVQHTIWDWDTADIELLCMRSHPKVEAQLTKLLPFHSINKAHRRAACPALGFTKPTSWARLSEALQERPDILEELKNIFHIRRRCAFEVGTPYAEQVSRALAAAPAVEPLLLEETPVPVDSSGPGPAAVPESTSEEDAA